MLLVPCSCSRELYLPALHVRIPECGLQQPQALAGAHLGGGGGRGGGAAANANMARCLPEPSAAATALQEQGEVQLPRCRSKLSCSCCSGPHALMLQTLLCLNRRCPSLR